MEFDSKTINRFWSKVQKTDTCWIWIGGLSDEGYGYFYVARKYTKAAVFSWILSFGKPHGSVLHSCDNRRCVRPDHLFVGTQADNMKDAAKKCRLPHGEQKPNAILTEEDVRNIRSRYEEGELQKELAREFGVGQAHISKIVLHSKWRYLDGESR